jgi:hypothetical protein
MDDFRGFAGLYDYKFANALRHSFLTLQASPNALKTLRSFYPNTNLGGRITEDVMRMTLMQFVGLLGAFLISLAVTLKMRWFWLNSVIAFIAGLIIFILKRAFPENLAQCIISVIFNTFSLIN